jgi:AcrR family transcriptional regulator
MRLAAKDRRAQLIEAAMRLFSVQGFDGTTTHQIARAAGVNEAIIFRHFATKEELYWAVVSSRAEAQRRKRNLPEHLDPSADEREVLTAVAEGLLNRTSEDAALTRLLLFSALRNPGLSDGFFRTYMAESFELVSAYFRKGIRGGRFRKLDPVVAARGFFGMIVYHYLVQELFAGDRYQQFDPRVLGRQLADIWLNGISVSTKPNCHNGVNGNNGERAPIACAPEKERTKPGQRSRTRS